MKHITQTLLLLLALGVGSCTEAGGHNSSFSHLDLGKAIIQQKLSSLPTDDDVLMEFFASWCPACRAFKPEYEKAAAFLLQHSKVHVYRLDCAVDPDICDKYKVAGYPTMYVGKAADMAAASVGKLNKFDYGLFKRDSAGVVQFVAKHLKLDLVFAEDTAAEVQHQSKGSSPSTVTEGKASIQWTAADLEAATQQLFASITSFHPTTGLKERRAALLLLLKMWSVGHPLTNCRRGAASLMQQLPQLWPEDATQDPWGATQGGALKAPTVVCSAGQQHTAATQATTNASYVACKGSLPDSRGFTCGLWLLFHSTAARLPEKDGGALLVAALKGFAEYFFQCEVCRSHFIKITSTPGAAAVRSRHDGIIWLWRVHNEVNARLQGVEKKYGHSSTGDPAFPKSQWPTTADCPLCRVPSLQAEGTSNTASSDSPEKVEWNEKEVYRFLDRWYGRQAGGPQVQVPGTALAFDSSREGGSAIMQAALAAEDAADSSSGLYGFYPGKLVLFVLAGLCIGVYCGCRQASVSRTNGRRNPGLKGPGALNPRHTAAHFLPRHARSSTSWL